ncbi:hypothetical protein [Priestia megaterium]|uniref:hypothetical protein n=1 Tax=Priestia megaterium TaxID=1404 RepID=UPI002E1E19A1|nr:hypothetical protein [Priestia megaterium]
MIPYAVVDTKQLGVPVVRKNKSVYQKKSFPLSSGLEMFDSNEICIRRAMVNLITVWGLRAAHIFHYKSGAVDWHMFQPSSSPVNQAEVNGHMIFAIQAMKAGEMAPCLQIDSSKKALLTNKADVMDLLNGFHSEDRIFIVLIFNDRAFATGNYFDESTLCKAIVNYQPPKENTIIWPEKDLYLRLLAERVSTQKPVIRIVERYNKKECK